MAEREAQRQAYEDKRNFKRRIRARMVEYADFKKYRKAHLKTKLIDEVSGLFFTFLFGTRIREANLGWSYSKYTIFVNFRTLQACDPNSNTFQGDGTPEMSVMLFGDVDGTVEAINEVLSTYDQNHAVNLL